MTPREISFRTDETSRAWLESVINNPIFKEAIEVLRERRNINEARVEEGGLANDGMTSTRMNSQRIGMEGVFVDLPSLTLPPPPTRTEIPDDYQEREAYERTHQ